MGRRGESEEGRHRRYGRIPGVSEHGRLTGILNSPIPPSGYTNKNSLSSSRGRDEANHPRANPGHRSGEKGRVPWKNPRLLSPWTQLRWTKALIFLPSIHAIGRLCPLISTLFWGLISGSLVSQPCDGNSNVQFRNVFVSMVTCMPYAPFGHRGRSRWSNR